MDEIIKNVNFKEFNLTIIRISVFFGYLYNHRNQITKERLVMYDFFLKYPSLLNDGDNLKDFDLQFSYFHWKPNYQLYNAVLSVLVGRNLILFDRKARQYKATQKDIEFVQQIECKYVTNLQFTSDLIYKKLMKLSNKKINEEIILQTNKDRWGEL